MSITVNSIANSQMQKNMLNISTGNRLNTAANDAAGLAIAEKMNSQIRGLEQGTRNTEDMQNLVTTAEAAMGSISENLQRMRELSIQAANGTLTNSDKALIQEEVNQLKQGISDMVNNTQFNNKQLLNGTFQNQNTASQANGLGMKVSIPNMSLDTLGITNFDVTNPASDVGQIDAAIEKVSEARSQLGAVSNTFSHTINSNSIASLNQAASRSRIADTDIPKAVSDLNKNRMLNQMQILMQNKEQENMQTNQMSLIR